jgi:hypothetical protein
VPNNRTIEVQTGFKVKNKPCPSTRYRSLIRSKPRNPGSEICKLQDSTFILHDRVTALAAFHFWNRQQCPSKEALRRTEDSRRHTSFVAESLVAALHFAREKLEVTKQMHLACGKQPDLLPARSKLYSKCA